MCTAFWQIHYGAHCMETHHHQHPSEWFGTRAFKEYYNIGGSTQKLWRDNGLPYYRVPQSTKILYKRTEVEAWLSSNKRG